MVAIGKVGKEHLRRETFTVLGGMHLLRHADEDLLRLVDDLEGLGVQKVGPTHCSG
jgi:metal-dependent hydrolase (beta-lactamase superfamily II)